MINFCLAELLYLSLYNVTVQYICLEAKSYVIPRLLTSLFFNPFCLKASLSLLSCCLQSSIAFAYLYSGISKFTLHYCN